MPRASTTNDKTCAGSASGYARPDVDRAGSPMRVAVICDFLEERWPSMDLAGDMLCRYLADNHGDVAVTQIRPPLRARLAGAPFFPRKAALNSDRLLNRFFDYASHLRSRRRDYDLFHVIDHSYSQLVHSLP